MFTGLLALVGNFARLIPLWVWPLLALAGFGAWEHRTITDLNQKVVNQAADFNAQRAEQSDQARIESERMRTQEESMRLAKQGATHVLETERSANDKRLTNERAVATGLRTALSAAAAHPAEAATDTVTACSARAGRFGDALGGVLQDLATCTGNLEDSDSSVRALLDAWPMNGT